MNRIVISLALLAATKPKIGSLKLDTYEDKSGVKLLAVEGQFDHVTDFIQDQGLNPVAIVADGDNSLKLSEDSKASDHKRQIVAIVDTPEGMSLTEAQATLDKTELLSRYKGKNWRYGFAVTAMDQNVDFGVWGQDYEGSWTERAMQARFDQYVDSETRTIVGSENEATTLLLIGRDSVRTKVGMISKDTESYKVIGSDFVDTVDNTLVNANSPRFLLESVYGTNVVNVVSAEQISKYLSGEMDELAWAEFQTPGNVTEISLGVDNTDNFILSLDDGEYAAIPVSVGIDDDTIQLIPHSAFGVKVADLGEDVELPRITRASHTAGLIEEIDTNGGENAVSFFPTNLDTDKPYGLQVAKMVEAASENRFAA